MNIKRINEMKMDEAKKAKEMADILEKGYSKYEPIVFKKEFPFTYVEGDPLWIILFLDKNSNSNAAKNKISSFNDEVFEKMDITVSSKLFESDQSVIILKSFSQTPIDINLLGSELINKDTHLCDDNVFTNDIFCSLDTMYGISYDELVKKGFDVNKYKCTPDKKIILKPLDKTKKITSYSL
jgi:hypothetical protein